MTFLADLLEQRASTSSLESSSSFGWKLSCPTALQADPISTDCHMRHAASSYAGVRITALVKGFC